MENYLGGSAVNSIHLIAFQEKAHHDKHLLHVPVERTRKRKSSALEDHEHIAFTAGTVAEPPRVTVTGNQDLIYDDTSFQHAQFVLIYFVKCNYCYDQAVPNVLGCRQALRKVTTQELQKTVETYVPPIASKVTGFTTISQCRTYLQSLAASANIPYVNITLDVDAAVNPYKFLWSNFTFFENVVIHLGNFHFMKDNFQASIFSTMAI